VAAPLGNWIIAIDGSALPARELIGGKAWSIARMSELGLNVPPAVVITTEACAAYLETGAMPAGLAEELNTAIAWLEAQSGRTFGSGASPLLVSVRSGAAISMPGMMDTVLNLGINADTEAALGAETDNPEFARDTHRRFLELYASIVMKATVPPLSSEAAPSSWIEAVAAAAGESVPVEASEQLFKAVAAVFDSSNSRRARRYRKHHDLPANLGTAVTIQAMVFGNLDDESGTGVLFSRNPLNGDPAPYGEYLHRAQGEDVVSGKFTPEPLSSLHATLPTIYDELLHAARTLENDGADVQDIEFTVQQGTLFLLQSRAAKRAPQAAVRFALDLVTEGLIDRDTGLSRVSAEQVRTLLQPHLADGAADKAKILASGEPACQGVGAGVAITTSDEAETRAAAGETVVLARPSTSPEDVHGMIASVAVVTDHGGSTSHAAVVSRALGVPCIVGCGEGSVAGLAGQTVTVDGISGKVFAGCLDVVAPNEFDDPSLATLTEWAIAACPVTVLPKTGELPADVLDLGAIDGGEDPEQLGALIGDARAVTGGAIESDAGLEAALSAGVECIVASHVLPVLLYAIERERQRQ